MSETETTEEPFVLPPLEECLSIVEKGGDASKDLIVAVLKDRGDKAAAEIVEEEWFRFEVGLFGPYTLDMMNEWDGKRGIDLVAIESHISVFAGKRLSWTTPYDHDRDFGDVVMDAVHEEVQHQIKEDL